MAPSPLELAYEWSVAPGGGHAERLTFASSSRGNHTAHIGSGRPHGFGPSWKRQPAGVSSPTPSHAKRRASSANTKTICAVPSPQSWQLAQVISPRDHSSARSGAISSSTDRKSTRLNSSHVRISYAV